MVNYRVTFFRLPPKDSDDKVEMLGSVVVDDHGTDNTFTVTAKAFRVANPNVLAANKVLIERV